eukprot:g18071.t1
MVETEDGQTIAEYATLAVKAGAIPKLQDNENNARFFFGRVFEPGCQELEKSEDDEVKTSAMEVLDGAETVAHSLQNGRITLCFVAFKGDPVIMRLYGTSKVVPRAAAESFLPNFEAEFTQHSGFRAVIVVDVHRVQGSCGFSIPIFDYVSERDILKENFAKKDNDQANDYRILKNSFSIDLLPSIGHRILNNKAPLVAARFKEGFWFGCLASHFGCIGCISLSFLVSSGSVHSARVLSLLTSAKLNCADITPS